eukprot:gene536-1948_t
MRPGCYPPSDIVLKANAQGRPVYVRVDVTSKSESPPMLVDPQSEKPQATIQAVGSVEVILGPMFAGKSTELLARIRQARGHGRSVLVRSVQAMQPEARESAATYAAAEVIAIDEAQFFDDLHAFVLEAADLDHKTVIVAGLDGDFQRRRFGQLLDIVPLADRVTKVGAKCQLCDKVSLFSVRIVKSDSVELVGGADNAIQLCAVNPGAAMGLGGSCLEAAVSEEQTSMYLQAVHIT